MEVVATAAIHAILEDRSQPGSYAGACNFAGLSMSAVTMRMTRTMMLEVLRQDYIRTARAKGLSEHRGLQACFKELPYSQSL